MESYQEKADAISKRFGIPSVEAMRALEECDGNSFDAVSLLEVKGVINNASARYTTGNTAAVNKYVPENFQSKAKTILFKKIEAYHGGELVIRIPLLFVLIFLCLSVWSVALAFFVGLLLNYDYRITD